MSDTTDDSGQSSGLSSSQITGIAIGVVIFVLSVVLQLAIFYRRERKRLQKLGEQEGEEREKGGSTSPPSVDQAEQGLAAKPELEGTTVGAVIPKMELDSNPLAELDSSRPVRELDGSESRSGPQNSELGGLGLSSNGGEDEVLPVPPEPGHKFAY
ncbi:hypothetical protein F4804DRAFT_351315 [Jackrogersella minutella]|nr:hypothetical protein F4804DRAFT_351315 [Jackrogersella minutella]